VLGKIVNQLILLTIPFLALIGCQSPIEFPQPTSVIFPTQTASPLPPTATATLTATAILPSPTPTRTLAPFPAEALSESSRNVSGGNVKSSIDLVPLAINPNDHYYFSHPVPVDYLGERLPSSRYGNDQNAENGAGHTGLDIGLDHGTPILAAGIGEVIFSGYGLLTWPENLEDPYGLSIVILHDFGFDGRAIYTAYAHLSQAFVEEGDRVEREDEIGRSGDTGFSSGPHIHFEVRIDGNSHDNSRNPELWLVPPANEGVLVGTILTTFGHPVLGQSIKLTHLETGRIRWAYSYSMSHNITGDDYYNENFVLGELTAGTYEIAVYYVTGVQRLEVKIEVGQTTYFAFNGRNGFDLDKPPLDLPPNLPN